MTKNTKLAFPNTAELAENFHQALWKMWKIFLNKN